VSIAYQRSALLGLWRTRKAPRIYIWVTRVSDDNRHVYGWACDASGKMVEGDRPTLGKWDLNAKRTAPEGFTR